MKNRIIYKMLLFGAALWLQTNPILAQETPMTLDQVIDKALLNNKLYQAKGLQLEEKRFKVKEDKIKAYPAVSVSSAYQYNASIGQLTIPQGTMGVLPLPTGNVLLPNSELKFDLGQHQTFNAGATIYQPISQLTKIKTGVAVAQTDVEIATRERTKAALQIRQSVEKLYYGILITTKQMEEANAKLALAKMQFYDLESAKISGKTIEPNESGLQANIADEEQSLLKLEIQREDYMADLGRLTGLAESNIQLAGVALDPVKPSQTLEDYKAGAMEHNVDIQLADLNKAKSELGIKAAKLSYRPDFGIFAGYTYQKGNIIFPQNNPYVGASLKWNVQDLFSNKEVIQQRTLLSQQAQMVLDDKREEVRNQVEKAYRKIRQAESLMQVAERAYTYRQQELKVQEDKKFAGLNTEADVLHTKSLLAKSEADLFAAQLNYRLAWSDLSILTERYE